MKRNIDCKVLLILLVSPLKNKICPMISKWETVETSPFLLASHIDVQSLLGQDRIELVVVKVDRVHESETKYVRSLH